jgi:hypothetical protein
MAEDPKTKPLTASPDDLLRTIFSYVGRIADERDIDQLLILLADMGRDLISADRCTVWLLNRKTEELWSKVAHGVDRITIPCSAGIAGCVAMTGESLIINDPYNDDRFDKDVDKKTGYHTRNILGLPINDGEGKIIGVYQAINKMPEPENFSEQDLEHLLLAATYTGKTLDAAMLQEEIEATQREIIFTLAETGEMRSKETGYHVKRVAEFSHLFAVKYGMSEDEAELLRLAAPMHDIGKIGIPDSILKKRGVLSEEEYRQMQMHTAFGGEIIGDHHSELLKLARSVAVAHHEKWDGSGYPHGLVGESIPWAARVVAIADVFDALTSDRPYKPAWPVAAAVDHIQARAGTDFDPALVESFIAAMPEMLAVRQNLAGD